MASKRDGFIRRHPGIVVPAVVLVLLSGMAIVGKIAAEQAANTAAASMSAQLRSTLGGATPEDFLSFNSGARQRGSRAAAVNKLDGFVNVRATAKSAVIRMQPDGWWSGFTERCVVAVVRASATAVSQPKVACVRVPDLN